MAMIYLLWLFLQAIAPPLITSLDSGARFLVSYPAGAEFACTAFDMQVKPGEEPYNPRRCWFLDKDSTQYEDEWNGILPYGADWDVYAEVGYVKPAGDGATYYKSNVIRIHR